MPGRKMPEEVAGSGFFQRPKPGPITGPCWNLVLRIIKYYTSICFRMRLEKFLLLGKTQLDSKVKKIILFTSIFVKKVLYSITIFNFSDLPLLKMPHKKTTKKERNRWLSKLIEVEQKLLEWSFEKDLSLLVQDGKNYS